MRAPQVLRFAEGGTMVIREDPQDAEVQIIRASRRPAAGGLVEVSTLFHGDDGRKHEVVAALHGAGGALIIHLAYIISHSADPDAPVKARATAGCCNELAEVGVTAARVFAAMGRLLTAEAGGPLVLSFLDAFEAEFLLAIGEAARREASQPGRAQGR